jgi:hypothetical protein
MLKGLRPAPLDLGRIRLVRERSPHDLARPGNLERLVADLGLNDEGMNEFPASLHGFCGGGLRIWQYPAQFGRYLARVAPLAVESYLELGVRHGGSFVATVEILDRFHPLSFAVGVDIIPCPAMADYAGLNPRARFECLNTQGAGFVPFLESLGRVDLVFVDSHHEEWQCRRELASLLPHANMIAMHDIANIGCPGIGRVWADLKAGAEFECFEFTEQYDGLGPYMGIGLAVRRERLAAAAAAGRPA